MAADSTLMTTEMRKAIRGRIAVVVLAAVALAGLLAWQQATRPDPIDGRFGWRLETVDGQHVHLNFPEIQRENTELSSWDGR